MNLLVTGHTGFVGQHLTARTGAAGLVDEVGLAIDITNPSAVRAAVERIRPDAVIHLAARAFVPDSVRDPLGTYDVNFLGTQHLLSALKASGFAGRVLYVSSADLYGAVEDGQLPIREDQPLRPLNPYAVSKIAAETLCGYFARAEHLDVVIARPFNHIGPGQSTRFALADFSQSIAEMALGRRAPLLAVGDLDVTRDFSDVRDVIEAYLLLLAKGRSGEVYNVCSGAERNLGDIGRRLAEVAGVPLRLEVDPARLRGASQKRSFGDNGKLRHDTGWAPAIAFDDTLQDMLNHCTKALEQ